jgi:hypothetical protein
VSFFTAYLQPKVYGEDTKQEGLVMQRTVVKTYGVLIALLAVMGLFVNDGSHMLGFMNADMALDWLRIALALFVLYAGFVAEDGSLQRSALWTVGVLYVGMGILAMVDPELWGLTPTGLTVFDVGFHLVTGLFAIAVASKKQTAHGAVSA